METEYVQHFGAEIWNENLWGKWVQNQRIGCGIVELAKKARAKTGLTMWLRVFVPVNENVPKSGTKRKYVIL